MMTDREKTIEKLWRNSDPATRWAEIAAAYDAGVAAERKRWEPALRALLNAKWCTPEYDKAARDAVLLLYGPNQEINGAEGVRCIGS